ncbi:MAG: hypothetical protein HN623_13255, partial [Bdellovibrionales bacterium]|nr:hypothetical protein [Bdellovibrionales bacterium]
MLKVITTLMTAVVISQLMICTVYANTEIAFPRFEKFLKRHGIAKDYSPQSAINLSNLIDERVEQVNQALSNNQLKDEHKDLKRVKKFLQQARTNIARSLSVKYGTASQEGNYHLAQQVLYTILSEDQNINKTPPLKLITSKYWLLKNLLLNGILLKVPYRSASKMKLPVGAVQAENEAKFLMDPNNRSKYISRSDLAQMNHEEISKLDISSSHPVWHTTAYSKANSNGWNDQERWAEKRISKKLSKKSDHSIKYSIDRARRVLFFDKIKISATSPKINTRDAYGVRWKVKWGDEVQPEVINNRLWMKLGGKYTDLVYSNPKGMEHLVLILGDPQKERQSTCDHPVTVKELTSCLRDSSYKFNLSPYITFAGTITKENIDRVLKELPRDGKKRYSKKELLGREYLSFKESLVELKIKKAALRGGPAAFSSASAKMDRVGRGLMIFNMWIANRDAKDDNNRSVLVKDYLNQEGNSFLEFQHDMGATLGNVVSGEINNLRTGYFFLRRSITRKNLYFTQLILYRPKAWKKITFADALWMARKISLLSESNIKEIVAHSNWPDFVQQAASYKLIARRNAI